MTYIRRFQDCKTEDEMLQYFIRKTPSAKMVHTKDFGEAWLPKLGAVCVMPDEDKQSYVTRTAAINAAKKYHNHISERLNLKPIYT